MTAQAYALTDQAFDTQRAFRSLLEAMSRPGKIISVGGQVSFPTVLQPSTAAIALSLFDHDTEIRMGDGIAGVEVLDFIRFQNGPAATSLLGDYGADVVVCIRRIWSEGQRSAQAAAPAAAGQRLAHAEA